MYEGSDVKLTSLLKITDVMFTPALQKKGHLVEIVLPKYDCKQYDRVCNLRGGIVFSNIVTTVSPTYAQEVRTAEGGHGLHSTLSSHSRKFIGILNGIDTDAWNPATDEFLPVQYNATDLHGKVENIKP
ncbi:hypothetical protein VIGAN_03162900 [Vigna angularis var. angularis]|uniref:starch synthase n=1 Tax=Vigna angularis var. angularis TaxID=157739 RepID=A0A0S3RMF2_PHAAN|nr:hypothetical protein VIGAN_03162900 [Vigna angularis var. angularis]